MSSPRFVGRLLRGPKPGSWWEVCVGLEIHAQVLAASKAFSGASCTAPLTADPNSTVALFDAAFPGSLPIPQQYVVAQALRAGLALRGRIHARSVFERKHYFYADLPAGYQITQLDHPIVSRGLLLYDLPKRIAATGEIDQQAPGEALFTRIERLQLEHDSGKSTHTLAAGASLVDLNRAGAALLEIVTAPDMRSPEEAGAALRTLQSLLRYTGVSDGAMEEGSLRCDVNVSLRQASDEAAAAAEAALVAPKSAGKGGKAGAAAAAAAAAAAYVPTEAAALYGSHVAGRLARGTNKHVWAPEDSVSGGHGAWVWAPAEEEGVSSSSSAAAGSGPRPAPASEATAAHRHAAGPAHAWDALWDPSLSINAYTSSTPSRPFGPRVEMKNLNSVRGVVRAVGSEAERQAAALDAHAALVLAKDPGSTAPITPSAVIQSETRGFNALTGVSLRLRTKEAAMDYRFTPDPDLPPLVIEQRFFSHVAKETMPSYLPDEAIARYVAAGLSSYEARLVVEGPAHAAAAPLRLPPATPEEEAAAAAVVESNGGGLPPATRFWRRGYEFSGSAYYDAAVNAAAAASAGGAAAGAGGAPPPALLKAVCNWLVNEVYGRTALLPATATSEDAATSWAADPVAASVAAVTRLAAGLDPGRLGRLVALVSAGTVSGRAGKEILDRLMGIGPVVGGKHSFVAPDGREPAALAEALGLTQLNDAAAIAALTAQVMADPANASTLAKWASGHERAAGALVKAVLDASGGRANPALVSSAVKEALGPLPPRK